MKKLPKVRSFVTISMCGYEISEEQRKAIASNPALAEKLLNATLEEYDDGVEAHEAAKAAALYALPLTDTMRLFLTVIASSYYVQEAALANIVGDRGRVLSELRRRDFIHWIEDDNHSLNGAWVLTDLGKAKLDETK
jgi:hypothetical protein